MTNILVSMAVAIVAWGAVAAYAWHWLTEMTNALNADEPPTDDGERKAA